MRLIGRRRSVVALVASAAAALAAAPSYAAPAAVRHAAPAAAAHTAAQVAPGHRAPSHRHHDVARRSLATIGNSSKRAGAQAAVAAPKAVVRAVAGFAASHPVSLPRPLLKVVAVPARGPPAGQ